MRVRSCRSLEFICSIVEERVSWDLLLFSMWALGRDSGRSNESGKEIVAVVQLDLRMGVM